MKIRIKLLHLHLVSVDRIKGNGGACWRKWRPMKPKVSLPCSFPSAIRMPAGEY